MKMLVKPNMRNYMLRVRKDDVPKFGWGDVEVSWRNF